ncbi:MAG: hypothetical protein WEA29_07140 [Acidimicrobiia bacterium]
MRAGTIAIVLALATAACSLGDDPGSGDTSIPAVSDPRVWVPSSEDYPSDFDSIPAEILADGVVTPAELERAVLASFACMEARGLEFEPEIKYGASGWIGSVGYSLRAVTEEQLEELSALAADCEVRLTEDVWEVVRTQIAQRDQEELLQEVIACMESRGVAVSLDDSADGPSGLHRLAPEHFDYCWFAAH